VIRLDALRWDGWGEKTKFSDYDEILVKAPINTTDEVALILKETMDKTGKGSA